MQSSRIYNQRNNGLDQIDQLQKNLILDLPSFKPKPNACPINLMVYKKAEPLRVKNQKLFEQINRADKLRKDLMNNNRKDLAEVEFFDRSSRKAMFFEIEQHVNYAKEAQARELNEKRSRLRNLLNSEDETLETEFQDCIKNKSDIDIKKREAHLIALKADRDYRRRKFIEEKRIQQQLENCDEIRPFLRQKLLDDSKQSQLIQMEDRKKIEEAEKDFNKAWDDVSLLVYKQMVDREADEQKIAERRNKEMIVVLAKQVRDKEKANQQFIKDDRHFDEMVNEENCKIMEEIKQKEMERRQQRTSYSRDLMKQLEQNAQREKELRKKEVEEERVYLEKVRQELLNDKEGLLEQRRIRNKENAYYRNYLENNLEILMKEDELIKEKAILDMKAEKDLSGKAERQIIKEKKIADRKETYGYCYKQMLQQKEREKEEQKKEFDLAVAARKVIQDELLHKKLTTPKCDYNYGKELLAQAELFKRQQKQDQKDDEELIRKVKQHQAEECDEFARKVMAEEIEILPMHPNLRVLRTVVD